MVSWKDFLSDTKNDDAFIASQKRRARKKDNYTCQDCGRSGDEVVELHVHHITPASEGGSHNLNNLITLCDYCHKKRHSDVNILQAKTESPIPINVPQHGDSILRLIINLPLLIVRSPKILSAYIRQFLDPKYKRKLEQALEERGRLVEQLNAGKITEAEFKNKRRKMYEEYGI